MAQVTTLRRTAAARSPGAPRQPRPRPAAGQALVVRPARRRDLDAVIAIDAVTTGLEKRAYWLSAWRRHGAGSYPERAFLVAELGDRVVGFVIGEVRDWEFGSPPCGWVFAIDVAQGVRLAGIGTRLLEAIATSFRAAGVTKLRTMLMRDNTLMLSFFRSQGMMAGPLIPLEMDLDPVGPVDRPSP
ncbi:MAG: N-acetyltransferase family protein [Caldimonas sp.]